MKILLINVRYKEPDYRYRVNKLCPPLGMAYIAGILRDAGHDVRILDMEAIRMEYDSLGENIRNDPADVIGIHGTTPTAHFMKQAATISRDACPDAKIVAGGPHVSLLPAQALEEVPEFDYILRGEAEYTMPELVSCIESNDTDRLREIPGIGFRHGEGIFLSDRIVTVDDIDTVPFPAYDLLPLDAYFYGSRLVETGSEERIFTIMSSRGCPHDCIFCCAPVLYGHRYRARSAMNVVDEMELLVSEYGISHVVFYDASFNLDNRRVRDICAEIRRRGIEVTWRARVRADRLSEDLLRDMKSAGCTTVSIGVESGSQRVLDILGKKLDLATIENAFEAAKNTGLWTVGYFIIGTPGETREETVATVEFAKKLDPDWALFTHSTPLPGTKLYEMTKDTLISEGWEQHKFSANSPTVAYDGMSMDEMKSMMHYAFREYYIREDWLMNRLKKATDPVQVERIVQSFFDYLEKTKA